MTRSLLLLLFISLHFLTAVAQDVLFPAIKNLQRTIIVKDSTGRIYSSAEWMPLTVKYQYKFVREDSTDKILVYKLVRMSDEDRKNLLSKVQQEETRNFKNGETIPSFNLKDINGNKFSIESLRGKIVVLYFCILKSPATSYQVNELNDLYNKFKSREDIAFIAITAEDRWIARDFIKNNNFGFRVCHKAENVMNKLDIYAWPTHVILDKSGKIRLHNMTYRPTMSNFWITNKIEEILQEEAN